MQYGPLRMEVGDGAPNDTMERNAAFDDNMDIVVQMISDMHNKQYEVKDFDMVSWLKCICYHNPNSKCDA